MKIHKARMIQEVMTGDTNYAVGSTITLVDAAPDYQSCYWIIEAGVQTTKLITNDSGVVFELEGRMRKAS